MIIRKIEASEVEKFHAVFASVLKDSFPEYSPELVHFLINEDFSLEVIKRKVFENLYAILLAEEGEQAVGFLVHEMPYGGESYAPWLGVIKGFQGRGIGRGLVNFWEEEILRRHGHKLILMTQSQTNRNIFPKYGFKEEGCLEKSRFGLDAWLFGKIIAVPQPEFFLTITPAEEQSKKFDL